MIDLNEVAQEMRTQDNACTRDPICVVYKKVKIYGMDSEFVDEYDWLETEDYTRAGEKKWKALDRYFSWFGQEPEGWKKAHYVEKDEFITCMFSVKAAREFIRVHGHKYRGNLHLYIESLYRSPEMIAVREALLAGRFSKAEDSGGASGG